MSGSREIQQLVELLDDPKEFNLKTNIINIFLLEQNQPAQNQVQANEVEGDDVKGENVDKDSKGTVEAKDEIEEGEVLNDDEAANEDEDDDSEAEIETPRRRGGKKKSKVDVDKIPVALQLRTDKGPDISKYYVIEQENAFEDEANMDEEGNEDDEHRSYEYFTFGKGRR